MEHNSDYVYKQPIFLRKHKKRFPLTTTASPINHMPRLEKKQNKMHYNKFDVKMISKTGEKGTLYPVPFSPIFDIN